ncbi:acyl-CoA thioesterase-1 [Granulicella aggregans]|uniref:Acyl-CoA thioesterase-1 n=1 Tax=Granulicella aggregans TaxID=474949 RepID=A0A7W7ZFX3_9BACT|nr:arylesterase [Granulicella aggregans]MBB5059077.1 acyl-CoA thioesterase-1 [Granulicella aggregans]
MRRPLCLIILAWTALAAAGCKSDSAAKPAEQTAASSVEPTSPKAEVPSTAHDLRPLLVCFGDSLTAGYGTDAGQSYPDYLQQALDAQGYRYRVVNEGVSGNTTKDGIDRLAGIVAMKPDVVIVEFGGNDGLRGLPIEESRTHLDTIIGKLKANGAKILIAGITLPPNYGANYIKQFDATYTLLAKKYDVPLMPFLLKDVYGVPGMMQVDDTHATAAGNKTVAGDLVPFVTPLLKK